MANWKLCFPESALLPMIRPAAATNTYRPGLFICDTDAGKPSTGLVMGDIAFAVDTLKWYRYATSTTWRDFDVIENRTSDPSSLVAGQCWLRTDL